MSTTSLQMNNTVDLMKHIYSLYDAVFLINQIELIQSSVRINLLTEIYEEINKSKLLLMLIEGVS